MCKGKQSNKRIYKAKIGAKKYDNAIGLLSEALAQK